MINRDPRCVFVADSPGVAEIVAAWLSEQGIPAQTMDGATLGGLEGLTVFSPSAVSSRGIEVWAIDPAQVSLANDLLKERSAELQAQEARNSVSLAPISLVCEECGHENIFGSNERGKVVSCVKCEAYLDVPSDDEAFDYFGEESEGIVREEDREADGE